VPIGPKTGGARVVRNMLKSKIHRARVTGADLHYEGSITIDRDLMDAADFLEFEKVHVLDVDNGNRLETYVVRGERGTGEVVINGAAARLVQRGDTVIILSYTALSEQEARTHVPKLVYVDDRNRVARVGPATREPATAVL
jgi:aspartate 1-decarboxylase